LAESGESDIPFGTYEVNKKKKAACASLRVRANVSKGMVKEKRWTRMERKVGYIARPQRDSMP